MCQTPGSHGYMPPESGEGLQTAQFPQDVFSLGVLAYQLLAMREGALMLPHPFDSARTRGGTFNRALCLHDNIIRYQLASDWLDPISTQLGYFWTSQTKPSWHLMPPQSASTVNGALKNKAKNA
eukprot:167072-Pelagomonas_calceolata.AAC.2